MGKVFAKFVHLFKPSAKGYELLHVAITDQKISRRVRITCIKPRLWEVVTMYHLEKIIFCRRKDDTKDIHHYN